MQTSIGCLILHGFAGDVKDVLPLARYLQRQGYLIECPTLEGHGMTRRHLGRSNRHQWIGSAVEAYQRLAMRTGKIVVIGFSMGGLLAFQVANRHPVSLLITLNTPYHYWDFRQIYRYLREDFRTYSAKYIKSMTIPFRSLLQFRKLLAETKEILPRIDCPYHIIQANRDDTVHVKSAEQLRQSVASEDVSVTYFENSGHLLLLGPESDDIIQAVYRMVRQLE